MILVDTSVWISHLRSGGIGLDEPLRDGRVVCHPFIIGELACGTMHKRAEILSLLRSLPMASRASHEEVLWFIEKNKLPGKGLGYIDMHLLASATLSRISLWSLDRRLAKIAASLDRRT